MGQDQFGYFRKNGVCSAFGLRRDRLTQAFSAGRAAPDISAFFKILKTHFRSLFDPRCNVRVTGGLHARQAAQTAQNRNRPPVAFPAAQAKVSLDNVLAMGGKGHFRKFAKVIWWCGSVIAASLERPKPPGPGSTPSALSSAGRLPRATGSATRWHTPYQSAPAPKCAWQRNTPIRIDVGPLGNTRY